MQNSLLLPRSPRPPLLTARTKKGKKRDGSFYRRFPPPHSTFVLYSILLVLYSLISALWGYSTLKWSSTLWFPAYSPYFLWSLLSGVLYSYIVLYSLVLNVQYSLVPLLFTLYSLISALWCSTLIWSYNLSSSKYSPSIFLVLFSSLVLLSQDLYFPGPLLSGSLLFGPY